jgi:3-oxoacyl-[acyl-carrier protein] reductase
VADAGAGRLAGKTAIVTGAAAGFGEGIARRFCGEGARVLLADVNGETAEIVAKELREAGHDAVAAAVDVTVDADLRAAVQRAVDLWGRVDVMVNNAGIAQEPTPIEDATDELFQRLVAVNMYGVFAGCRAVVPVMKAQGGGVIITTASTAAVRPRPLLNLYNASKAFALNLTKTLALELAPHRIRVNAINPVMGETAMLKVFTGEAHMGDERRAQVVSTIPLGRMSTPDDIAWAAVYLASDEASLVTGHGLEVDGGRDV